MTEQYKSLHLRSRRLGPVWEDNYSYSFQPPTGVTWTDRRFSGPSFGSSFSAKVRGGFECTWSKGNPWPPMKGARGSVGGPFRTVKRWFSKQPWGDPQSRQELAQRVHAKQYSGDSEVQFHYDIIPSFADGLLSYDDIISRLSPRDESRLLVQGTQAIERCKPTKTVNQLFVALTELKRDGIPDGPFMQYAEAWRKFRSQYTFKQVDRISPKRFVFLFREFLGRGGGEFLNLAFGWLPLASDTAKLVTTLDRLPQLWDQFERDAGRRVRRSYSFPPEITTTSVNYGYGYGAMPQMSTPAYTWYGSQRYDVHTSRSVVFNGAFCYTLPDREGNTPLAELYRFAAWANKLYGVGPTLDSVWNVIPWTWAADWITDIGSVVSNLSDYVQYGLVMEYGYVSERIRQNVNYYSDFSYDSLSGGSQYYRNSVSENRILLNRVEASPFGFGLTWDGFTPFQLAILASLGINRR